MNILFFVRSLDSGGTERQLVTLTRALFRQGHQVAIAMLYGEGRLTSDLRESGIEIIDLRKAGRWSFGFLPRLVSLVRARRPDVLHSYLVVPNLITALVKPLLRGVPVVWGVRTSEMDFSGFDWAAALTFRLERWLSWLPDAIIYNSAAGRAHHERLGYPVTRGHVIPNGIDTEIFRASPDAGRRLREAWRIPQSAILIGLPARIDPLKGHDTFLRAAALWAARRPEARFAIIGDGNAALTESLRELARGFESLAGRVVWAGYCPDMTVVYAALDIACLASITEGFPNTVGEAMACGVPCVVTDVGDAALLVGKTGAVVPPNDPEVLAATWDRMIAAGELRAVGDAARERIETNYTPTVLAERTVAALASVVRRLRIDNG